jgi:hypothetical protein
MKELIEQPVSKVGKEMKLEKQNVQAPQIDQEIWTYQKVMEIGNLQNSRKIEKTESKNFLTMIPL